MAKLVDRLTDFRIARIKGEGRYPDGRGLYLVWLTSTSRSWLFRYMLRGRSREMGLGPYPLIGIAEARQKRDDARRLLLEGTDPIDRRRAGKVALALTAAKSKSVDESFMAWAKARSPGWDAKSESVRRGQYRGYIQPVLGSLPVAEIDTDLVLQTLEPIWTTKSVTAAAVRGIIEAVLDYAKTRKWRTGDNPAKWKGHLENTLAKPNQIHKVEHHPALPYTEMGKFMAELRALPVDRDTAALEFIILTAARVGQVRHAIFGETITDPEGGPAPFAAIDLKDRIWSTPAERMKARKLHRTPLSGAALAVIERLDHRTGPLFPKLTDKSIERLLRKKMGYSSDRASVHGFRSTFKDWATDCTEFPDDISEKALAHKVGNETKLAYQRSDLLEKRRRLMEEWAEFCAKPAVAG
jgi:integrase